MSAPSTRQKLVLKRLGQGPLRCKDPEGLAASFDSLKVMIFRLRAQGYPIVTERDPHTPGRSGHYVLVDSAD